MAVYWITGLSGVGKSTLAKAMHRCLQEHGQNTVLLDGDEIRAAIADHQVQYDKKSRLINAYRISRLAELFAKQNLHVVVATISLFHEIHAWNKQHIPDYVEIWLKQPKNRQSNDVLQGPVMGIHIKPEFPLAADVELENDAGLCELYDIAEQLCGVAMFEKRLQTFKEKRRLSGTV